jgi:hypothetical protein
MICIIISKTVTERRIVVQSINFEAIFVVKEIFQYFINA